MHALSDRETATGKLDFRGPNGHFSDTTTTVSNIQYCINTSNYFNNQRRSPLHLVCLVIIALLKIAAAGNVREKVKVHWFEERCQNIQSIYIMVWTVS